MVKVTFTLFLAVVLFELKVDTDDADEEEVYTDSSAFLKVFEHFCKF